MKLLIDMNLSPAWVDPLRAQGFEAIHWTHVGDPRATDREILAWALSHGHVLLTHDLDFGSILAVSRASGPSVLQVRTQDVTPDHLGPLVLKALSEYRSRLEAGALITVDESRLRVRILPLRA